jgi:hypothetical protein
LLNDKGGKTKNLKTTQQCAELKMPKQHQLEFEAAIIGRHRAATRHPIYGY